MDEVKEEVEVSLAEALSAEFDRQTEEPEQEVVEVEATESDEVESEGEVEVSPPEHWSDEDKEAFLKMDEVGRDLALRMESNFHKGIEEKSKLAKRYQDALEPYKHMLPPGVDDTEVIKRLLNAQSFLTQDPDAALKWLAESYGVDLSRLNPQPQRDDDEYIDPDVKKLQEEISSLKSTAEKQQIEAANRQKQAMFAEVSRFRDAVGDDGELLHPHFNEVQGVMAGLLQSGRADSIEAAYEQAVWAVPEYRDDVIQRQAEERAKAEREQEAKTAEEAKKASRSVKGKSSAKKPREAKTIRDALSEAYDKSMKGEI